MYSLLKFLVGFSLLISNSWGQVNIKIDPPKPIKGESFNIIFEIETKSNDNPFVSFTPVGLEVLGRRKEVSLQTSMINGKFTSSRNYNLIYEVVSDQKRTARIRDIVVEVGSKKIKHKPVSIQVLGQRKKASSLFLKAEVSKKNIFLGEGIDVNYYLYSRVQVVQAEIKSFPKLKGFIKRFHKVNERQQAVEYNGLVYKRSLKYSARVYPEKIGKLNIDPLKLVLQYSQERNNPFGGIGFGFGRFKSKGVSSPTVKVTVNPLPSENVPAHFTGLIGEHKFNFTQAKNKFVVNEAIEGKLEVTGPGALEKLEAIPLYTNQSLEQFDAKSEFIEVGNSSGRKTFEYTYLARANLVIEEKTLPLSYFDPDTKSYVSVDIKLPKLEVVGGANSSGIAAKPKAPFETIDTALSKDLMMEEKGPTISAPLFSAHWRSLPVKWTVYLNLIALIGFFIILTDFLMRKIRGIKSRNNAKEIIAALNKKGLSYGKLSQLIFLLDSKSKNRGVEPTEILKNSNMPKKDIDYFLETLNSLERKNFGLDKEAVQRVHFRTSSFKEIEKVIDHESI